MLLTLLPFTAWAANINNEQILVANITYGSAAAPEVLTTLTPTTQFTISAVYYKDAACTIVAKDATNHEYSTATEYGKLPVGTYYLKIIGAGAYAGTEKVCDFVVNPAPLTLTVTLKDAAKHKTYDGQTGKIETTVVFTGANANATAIAAGVDQLKNDDEITGDNSIFKGQTLKFAYTGVNANKTPEGAAFGTPVPGYAISFSGYTAANYTITYAAATFDIWQKDITVTTGTAVTINLPTKTAVYNGAKNLPSYTVAYGSAPMTVGEDYDVLYFSEAARTTPIDPATEGTITNVAKYYTKIQGKGNFAGTKVVTGTATGYQNYIWEITKKSASVIANSTLTKEYDGTLNKPALEAGQSYYELSGVYSRDGIVVDPTKFVVTADGADPAYTGVGVKNVTIPTTGGAPAISSTTLYGLDNYNFNVVPGTFTVTPAELTITVNAGQEKSVGEADPALAFTLTGAATTNVPGSDPAITEENYIRTLITLTREPGEDPGDYPISVDYDDTDDIFANYDVSVDDTKKFKINGAKIIITTLNKTKVYGDADPVDFSVAEENVTFRIDGLAEVDRDKFDVSKLTISREAGENVKYDAVNGTYDGYLINATYTGPAIANYEGFEIVTGKLTITKAPLTITPIIQTIAPAATYAQLAALNQAAVSPVGLKNGDGLENLEYTVTIDNGVVNDGNSNTPGSYNNAIVITVTTPEKIVESATAVPSIHNGNYQITSTAKAALILSTSGHLATLDISDTQTDIQEIVDANDGKNMNVAITFHRNQTLGTGTDKERKWEKEKWNSLVLPFDITPLELCQAFHCYAIFNVVDADKTTENNVAFKLKMSGTINANTPFIVKTENNIANGQSITFNNVTIKKPSTVRPIVVEAGDYTFEGTYKTVAVDKTKSYLRFLLGNSEKWAYIKNNSESTWNIVPFAAFVNLGESQSFNAREVTFTMQEADGSTTTIRSIDADTTGEGKAFAAQGWYTLDGMKLNAAPTEKGVYINNGKKVVIK